jgi:hypothetical protein
VPLGGSDVVLIVGVFEFFEFVSEGGGTFKFEFFGGFEHLFFEVKYGFVDTVFNAVFGDYAFDRFISGIIDSFKAFLDLLLNGFGDNVIFEIEGVLFLSSGIAFGEHPLHGLGDFIGVEDNASFDVPSGAPGGLDESAFGAQETFFIGI